MTMRLDPMTSASTERDSLPLHQLADGGLDPWDGMAGDPTDGGPREHETVDAHLYDPLPVYDANQHLEAHR